MNLIAKDQAWGGEKLSASRFSFWPFRIFRKFLRPHSAIMKSLFALLLFVGLALFSELAASQGNPFGACFGACNGIILSDQDRLTQQQTENLRLQNEALRNQLIQQQRLAQQQLAQQRLMRQQLERQRELQDWEAANPWFGRDKAKTDFALQYARQLRAQQSPLTGRQFYDAVARKVATTFPPHQQKRK